MHRPIVESDQLGDRLLSSKNLLLCAAVLVLFGLTIKAHAEGDAMMPFEKAIERLTEREPTIPGVIVAVSAPRLGIEWQGAAGSLTLHGTQPLKPTDAFRIASVTKVFVAATALRSIEQGRFKLADSIRSLLSDETVDMLQRGGYDVDRITVDQLLTHTSGIFDFASDRSWPEVIASNPSRSWARAEEVRFAMEHGHKLSEPGAEYHYSDTGYLVIAEIIERSTGLSLPAAVRKLLKLDALGLKDTHFEKLELAPTDERRTHQYLGGYDITGVDPSFDLYGGGGIVTTASDLVHFIRPLMQGKIFENPATLSSALILPAVENPSSSAHTALLTTVKLGSRQCWSHGGYWGVLVAYCPDLDLAVAITVGQSQIGGASAPQGTTRRTIDAAIGEAIDEAAKATKLSSVGH